MPSTETPVVSEKPVGHDGTKVAISEKPGWVQGAGAAVGLLVLIIALLVIPAFTTFLLWIPFGIIVLVLITMFRVISPGHTQVNQFFGRYVGTNRTSGLSIIPPLCTSKNVSVRVRNFETAELKVNDANGNPLNIGAIVVWQVADTAKASFAVEEVEEFIHSQSESALRHVTTNYSYTQLSSSTDQISSEIANEVAARATLAGVEIIEARISTLAYAPEIAQSMLQRQQAAAIVDARETIVEGAVSMVESALDQLEEKDIVDLDPERRAQMVSNLLVVLCSDNHTQPVVNAGSLY
ncbi:SPFH domain-containing protein [Corynebacterium pyruviciproducens]|uniref:SPFH domain-containing protein n=1 Tax=Corynebacterium pyruviciproducens TaxID=598660 RepID=UPI00254F5F15|nr:SPFH domain-containing protein [Corynebacterium pyruviciproducens]MDK7214686.1 SPFH domain-containing protein [Corynebacterium pyruviciproducens]